MLKGGDIMKKIVLLAAVALALLIPTGAGFAERDDFPRLIEHQEEM